MDLIRLPKPALIIPGLRRGPAFHAPVAVGGAYEYFRINVTAHNGGAVMMIGELKVFKGASEYPHVAMTANNAPPPYEARASSQGSADQAAWKAFNKVNATLDDSWSSSGATGWLWLHIGAGNPVVASEYRVTGATFDATRSPRDWTFEGSNDETNWDILDTQVNQTGWGIAEERIYPL